MSSDSSQVSQEQMSDTGRGETRVVKGEKEVEAMAYAFLERASQSYLLALSDTRLPADVDSAVDFTGRMMTQNPKFEFRLITDIQHSNIEYYKMIEKLGVQVRHIEGNRVSFALSAGEYIATPLDALEELGQTGSAMPREVLWSSNKDLVSQANQIFEVMWKSASPARIRFSELEQGTEYSRIQVLTEPKEIAEKLMRILSEAQREMLVVFPSVNAFHREEALGAIDLIEQKSSRPEIFAKILSPLDEAIRTRIGQNAWQSGKEELEEKQSEATSAPSVREMQRSTTSTTATVVLVDRAQCLVIEQKADAELDFSKAVGLATYSNSKPTVNSYYAFFQTLWRETDLKKKEEASRRQSELLQDILTHDIRNYNQASRMGAEILAERVKGDEELEVIANTVIQAIDGSTQLVEKARKLGKIIADQRPELKPIDLMGSLERSLLLVKSNYPTKVIKETRRVSSDSDEIRVLADDLLDEVFINLFSNAVKFDHGTNMRIDISVEERNEPSVSKGAPCWQITVADHGPGIPSADKQSIFQRYSKGHRVSGLGLSIVHTLVAERYLGAVKVRNREGSNETGAVFDVLLRKA